MLQCWKEKIVPWLRSQREYWNRDRIRAFIRLLAGKIGFYVIILVLLVYCMATMPVGEVETQTSEVQIEEVSAFMEIRSGIRSTRKPRGIRFPGFGLKGKTTVGYTFTDTEGNRYRLEGHNPGLVQGGSYTLTYMGRDGEYTILGASRGDEVLIDAAESIKSLSTNETSFWIILATSAFLLMLILRGTKKACQDLKLGDYVQSHRD